MVSIKGMWSRRSRGKAETAPAAEADASLAQQLKAPATAVTHLDLDIAPNDPLLAYLQSASGPVEIANLKLDSPALEKLRAGGAVLVLPLVSQGELVGLVNLGPRLSEQDYSLDDRKLLADLAAQAAPAVRVAQLVRQQQIETQARERLEQELRVARVIQQTLLPRELPKPDGWQVAAHWQPAQAVSGDFYDFINLPGGKLAVIVADVTGKGVPAALVMAAARSMLRMAAEQEPEAPGKVLAHVNEMLCGDIPPNMFVTCLYGILDPATGRFVFANAGHNLPAKCATEAVVELRATGMPLGLLPGMEYDEQESNVAPGESVLIYSDGLVEAHNPQGEMFGFPRLRQMACGLGGGSELIERLRGALADFAGAGWEQEDDVTFVTVQRLPPANKVLANFKVASAPDNEREAVEKVAGAVAGLGLPADRLERLKTAVAEATMNAMEHGNNYDPDKPVVIEVRAEPDCVVVAITDQGGEKELPQTEAPDLDAKLAGLQSPRGWGLFLIKSMVDEVRAQTDGPHHTVELTMRLANSADGATSAAGVAAATKGGGR
ncbi:MAG: SpoIIE family protein phosphatase [Anaerolineae bacterium]|nr:SpoIIE family protein phosphatase [Anaerolineae bacterium]